MAAQRTYLIAEERADLNSTFLDVLSELVDDFLRPVLDEMLYRPGPLKRVPVLRFFRPIFSLFAETQNVVIEAAI